MVVEQAELLVVQTVQTKVTGFGFGSFRDDYTKYGANDSQALEGGGYSH